MKKFLSILMYLAVFGTATAQNYSENHLNKYEYVDLGLPSGTLWATTNVGAASPADHGDYFAWGEISPKEEYSWNTYKWCNGSKKTLTKYLNNPDSSPIDNKIMLESNDDAATAIWGDDWRIPTKEEQQELANTDYCTWTWTTKTSSKGESINGYEVKSKSNENSIFLPAAGYCYNASLLNVGTLGGFWSSSLDLGNTGGAQSLYFNPQNPKLGFNNRYYGLSIRPVCATSKN